MEAIVKLIVDYGFAAVFMGGMMLFLYAVGKRILALLDIWISKQKKKTPAQLEELNAEDAKIDKQINNVLFDIMKIFNPDRVMVLQYHNGQYYNSGQHMKFISCTHEQPNVGVQSGFMDLQKIPSAIFQPLNSPLINGEDKVVIEDVLEERQFTNRELTQREMYKNMGYKSYYAFALNTHEGHLIGKVVIAGIHKKITFTKEQLSCLSAHSAKVESLLNFNRRK